MSATSSPTHSFAMPEPEPFHEPSLPPLPSPQRPSYSPTDTYMSSSSSGSNDLLRRVTAGSVNNRRLPQAPDGTSTFDGPRPPVPPIPNDNRSPIQASYNSSVSFTNDDSHANSLARLPSYRPPGARPPTVPGPYAGRQSPTYDPYNGDGRTHNGNEYYKPVDTRQFQPPMLAGASSPQSVPLGLHRTSGQEYLTGAHETFPASIDLSSKCLYLA
jgi:hypothetical protein